MNLAGSLRAATRLIAERWFAKSNGSSPGNSRMARMIGALLVLGAAGLGAASSFGGGAFLACVAAKLGNMGLSSRGAVGTILGGSLTICKVGSLAADGSRIVKRCK